MNKSARKILLLLVGTSLGIAIAWGGFYMALRAQFTSALSAHGIHQARLTGFKLYLDGLVIDRLQMGQLDFQTLYFSGAPWALLKQKPDYIYIEKLAIDVENIFSNPMQWPFAPQTPLTIENVSFHQPILGQDILFRGKIKHSPDAPLLFDFKSRDPILKLKGQTELRLSDYQLNSIDIEFDNAKLNIPSLRTKRTSGWLSFTQDQNWSIIGEIASGFILLNDRPLFDSTLKLNGTVDKVDFNFSGLENPDQTSWVFDHQDDKIYIRHLDTTKMMEWGGLTPATLTDLTTLMTSFPPPIIEKKIAVVGEKSKKIPIIPNSKPIKPPSLPEPESLIVEEMTLPEKSFADLARRSLFADFSYFSPLVYVASPCAADHSLLCWTAHGTKGQFHYDPQNLPAYFLRQKNYAESQKFRQVLLNFNVETITLKGKDDAIEQVDLKGTTAEGQPAYIELSVEGLE